MVDCLAQFEQRPTVKLGQQTSDALKAATLLIIKVIAPVKTNKNDSDPMFITQLLNVKLVKLDQFNPSSRYNL